MEKYIILPDVTCDLSEDIRNEIGLEHYVHSFFHVESAKFEKDYDTTLDWNLISRDEFYKFVGDRKCKVTTAPPTPELFEETFEKYVSEGYAVLSMSISSKISATYGFATKAAERVLERHPDAKIHCTDSFRMSGAFGLLVICACLLKKEGKSFDEVVDWVENNKYRIHQMGPIDDLIFVARRGNITMGKAIMGNFAGVKPMGDCNDVGYVTVLTKAKGIKNALDLTIKYVEATAKDIGSQTILVSHSNREAYANALKEQLEKALHPKKVYVSDVYPGCGPNIGPGMIGVYYLGDAVSENNTAEKEIMARLTAKS